jgi:hypothetical protein
MSRPKISQMVLDEFANIIDSQDKKGMSKYGKTIDDASDADYDWKLMALEETADLQKYLVRRIKQLEGQLEQAKGRIKELESIKDVEVYWNSAVKINYENGEEKCLHKVWFVDAFLSLDKKAPYEDIDD